MSASELPRSPESAFCSWRDTPFQLGRMPFGVQLRPFLCGCFAFFESLEWVLAPAFRSASRFRFFKKGWPPAPDGANDDGVASSAEAAVLAYGHGLSLPDLELAR